jgi:hypothetical protein
MEAAAMVSRTMPLRNAQTSSRKTTPRKNGKVEARHVNGPRVNGQLTRGKPKLPGAQFLSRDQIMPFDKLTFGLIDPYDRGVRIFRVEKYVNPNDRIMLAWKRTKSWLTGRYIYMQVKEDGTRRVAMQTLGWTEPGDPPKHYGQQEFEWYDLGPADLIAVEVGLYYATETTRRFKANAQSWPDAYKAAEAPEPDEWERQQKFAIPNPPSSPWPKWDELYVDPIAPIGDGTWVAGFEVSDQFRRPILGPAHNVRQNFTVTDVRTGKEVAMGDRHGVFYGAVVGMSERMLDRKERKRAAAAKAKKAATKARQIAKARSTNKTEA